MEAIRDEILAKEEDRGGRRRWNRLGNESKQDEWVTRKDKIQYQLWSGGVMME